MATILQFFSKWYSKLTTFDNDVDNFFLLKLPDIVIGLNSETWEGTRKRIWRIWLLVCCLMFLNRSWSLRNAIQIKDYYDNVVQLFYMWFSYVIVAAQIYIIKDIRKEQETIRRFVNQRKLLRYDDRAFRKRTRSFRNNTRIVFLPLVLATVNLSLLFRAGTILTAEYVVVLELDESFELISEVLLLISVAVITFLMLVMVASYVFINTLLSGLTTEAEIPGDYFADLESRVVAFRMKQATTSVFSANQARLYLLLWRTELKECVGFQQEFLECIQCLKRITKPLTIVQYYVSFLFIADSIWVAFYGKQSVMDMCSMFFVLFFVFQCGLMFYLVERLEDENGRIGFIMYSSPWPMILNFSRENFELSKEIRATILFVMQRANEKIKFSCGGFFPMTLERFGDMLRMTYALLMAILNTNA